MASELKASTPSLHYATLLEAADAVRSFTVSPVELTQALLERINALDASLHSYALVTSELALAQATKAQQEIAAGRYRGPLHGIPVAVKDLCNTAGIVTAAGMQIHANNVPDHNATVVQRLFDAGAVLLGKLQLTEGAFATYHPAIIAPRNPWSADYFAGASSSGSGVATAAGLCFGSLGSDTGGSIRFPCAADGITGLKPTWGRVSRYGVFELAGSLDHIGPMTRSAADAGVILGAIAGRDPNDPTTLPVSVPDYARQLETGIRGLRIGIDVAYNETGCDDEIVATMREAADVFEDLGATIMEVRVPDTGPVVTAWGLWCAAEAALAHETTYPARASEYGRLAGFLDAGRAVAAIELMKAHHERLAFTGALAALFRELDVLLIPTQPCANLTVARHGELLAEEGHASFLRFMAPFNMSGSPTITLPGGFTARGLPTSFQLVGRHLEEALLVRAGHTYQQATDWHRKRPPL